MTVERFMSREVRSMRPGDSLAAAAAEMWEHDCGCVPICADDGDSRVIAMLTDRDICMAALFQGRPLGELKVADAMSRDIRVCEVDERLEDVELIMREQQIRRVPVTDADGGLVGILSLADLARAANAEAAARTEAGTPASQTDLEISERDVGHTLAAICEPAGPRPGEAT